MRKSIKYQVSRIKTCFLPAASIFFFILFFCSEEVEIPADVLPKEKMSAVLSDIHEVESLIQYSALERTDSTRTVIYGYYKTIFQNNKITPEEFKRSFNFYSTHLNLLDEVYEEVLVDLSKRQAEEGN